MKNSLFYEKSIFVPALFVSASIHGLLLGASGWISSTPYASVLNAPSSLEVTVISRPVVSIIEEEIVSEEILEGNAKGEVVFSNPALKDASKENIPHSVASKESRGSVTKAEPLTQVNPAPPYPRLARQRGWEGIVRLEVFVDKDGIPSEVGIEQSSGHGILDKAALSTVEKWKFSPARSGAIRFFSRVTIPIQFALIKEE